MYPCACCGYLTQAEPPPDTHAICEVCDWEDDAVQLDDETFSGGANAPSLAEARANYARIGASDPDSLDRVRKPRPEEYPNPEVDNDATRITRLEAAVLSVFSASVREAARLVPGHLRVQRREIEPVGFFTRLEPTEATRVFPNNRNLAWSGLGARFGTVDVGFVVFVNAGCVTMIEGYTYGDDWPSGEPDALYSI